MPKKKSLEQWCIDNQKEYLLSEWDKEKNTASRFPMKPNTTEYCSPLSVWWKCGEGHQWHAPIQTRTTFGLGCPICNPNQRFIPIGTKYGCLTVLSITAEEEDNHHSWLNEPTYRCICDCGKEACLSEICFLEKRHRYCTESIRRNKKDRWQYEEYDQENQCGLKTAPEEKRRATYKRIKDPSCDLELTGTIHESLEVLECVDENYEELYSYSDLRKKAGGPYYVYKLYKCRCYLCSKEQQIKSSKFSINPPTEYGYNAYNGYWSDAHCDCHPISSFQWIVTKLLKENAIPYRVEVSFPDLYGEGKRHLLRYDFGVYDDAGNIKCLIECQGEQHYKPVEEFGGEAQFILQKENDELKRTYAEKHGIPLYEIPYEIKNYEKIKEFLCENGIIR